MSNSKIAATFDPQTPLQVGLDNAQTKSFLEELARQLAWSVDEVRTGLRQQYGGVENGMKVIRATQAHYEASRNIPVTTEMGVSGRR